LIASGLAASKGEAQRGLAGKGFSVNGVPQTEDRTVGPEDLLAGRFVLLQKGRKNYALIDATD
jgi:tyrosyl-tRNA synthetase